MLVRLVIYEFDMSTSLVERDNNKTLIINRKTKESNIFTNPNVRLDIL